MNNFTKEELCAIKYMVESWRGEYGCMINRELIEKIQSMIDDYDKQKDIIQTMGEKLIFVELNAEKPEFGGSIYNMERGFD